MESSIVIKVEYGGTLRRFNAPVVRDSMCLSMDELKQKICHLFKIPSGAEITLTYTDEDDDEITLEDDDELKDVVKQKLDPLRISVKLKSERKCQPSKRSGEDSSPSRPPMMQPSFLNENAGIPEHYKTGAELLHETIFKLTADMASKATSSAPPVISELAETLSKTAMSCLNSFLETQRRVPESASGVTENSPSNDGIPSGANEGIKPSETTISITPESVAFIFKENASASPSEPLVGPAVRDPEPNKLKVDVQVFGDSSLDGKAHGVSRSTDPSVIKNNANNNRDCSGFGSINSNGSAQLYNPFQPMGDSKKTSHDSHLSSAPPYATCGIVDGLCFTDVQRNDNPFSPPHVPFDVPHKRSHGHSAGTSKVFHKGVRCDGCGVHPIAGPRFKSLVKENYDLCVTCFHNMGSNEVDYIRMDHPLVRMHLGIRHNRPKLDSCFVEDVNIPDGTIIIASTQFTKIWRIRNSGNIFWPKGTQLVWIGGDKLGDVMSVDLEIPPAGLPVEQELDIAVDFVAPSQPGRYISYWNMASPFGEKFGQRVWVQILVLSPTEDPSPENLHGLNLNLPPATTGSMIDVNVEPVLEGMSSMKEQEVNFPITDSLITGLESGQDAKEDGLEWALLRELEDMGFKQIDLNKEILRSNKYDLEQSVDDLCGVSEWYPMLEELEEMGFHDKEVNKELLKKNGGSIKRVVMDLITRE